MANLAPFLPTIVILFSTVSTVSNVWWNKEGLRWHRGLQSFFDFFKIFQNIYYSVIALVVIVVVIHFLRDKKGTKSNFPHLQEWKSLIMIFSWWRTRIDFHPLARNSSSQDRLYLRNLPSASSGKKKQKKEKKRKETKQKRNKKKITVGGEFALCCAEE